MLHTHYFRCDWRRRLVDRLRVPTVPDPSTYADALAVLSRYGIRKQIPRRGMLHLERGAAGLEAETPKSQHAADGTGPLILASIEDAISAATQRAAMEGMSVSTPTIRLSGNTHLGLGVLRRKCASWL